MTTHTSQQTLANALNARTTRIVGVGLSLVILVGGVLGYHSATAPRPAQGPAIQLAAGTDEASGSAVGPSELAYVSAFMSEEQLQHYLDGRQGGLQAGRTTCSPVGSDELRYVGGLLNDAQLQRYLDGRRCPPA
jgi:hypothetical protein